MLILGANEITNTTAKLNIINLLFTCQQQLRLISYEFRAIKTNCNRKIHVNKQC
jgi:hypothetical protein